MLLTCGCPKCGKEYDLPWSLVGKKARCKRCEVEFVVPAPIEPKGPKSSEAIPVFDPAASAKPAGPRPIAAQDPPPTKLLVGLRSGRPAATMKLESPKLHEPKVERRPAGDPPDSGEERPTTRPADRPSPRLDDPLFPTTSRTSARAERPRSRPRPIHDDDDDEMIDPVTGSRKRPAWLIPAFVIVDLVIVLIVVGQLSMFVGGDDDDDDEPIRRSAPSNPADRTNFEPAQLPDPVPSYGADVTSTSSPNRPKQSPDDDPAASDPNP